MKTLIPILMLFMLASCNSGTQENTVASEVADSSTVIEFTSEQYTNAGLETGVPMLREMHRTIRVNGKVDVPPQNRVSITFPMGGFLKSTNLLPGMKISKGQVLAVMQDQSYVDLQQDFLQAVLQCDLAKKEYERQSQLHETRSVSDKVFEQTKSDYESLQISLSALRQKLLLLGIQPDGLRLENISRTVNILSPIDGFVSKVYVNTGQYLNPDDVLFELVDPKELHLALTVFEQDLPYVTPGQHVKVSLPAKPDQIFTAEVAFVNQELDENRAAEVHCEFTEDGAGMMTGAFVTAEIQLTNVKTLSVPDEAVVRLRESEYVFVELSPLHYERIQVVTGVSQGGWTEISYSDRPIADKTIITKNAWSVLMLQENAAE